MKKYITGVLITNVGSLINLGPKTYDRLMRAKTEGYIDEVVLIPVPYTYIDGQQEQTDEQVLFNYAYAKSYVDRAKQFNICQSPTPATSNEEYIQKALTELHKGHSHQTQIILQTPDITPVISDPIKTSDYVFDILVI